MGIWWESCNLVSIYSIDFQIGSAQLFEYSQHALHHCYSKCWWCFLGCPVGWWPPFLAFSLHSLSALFPLLAFCNLATCSFSRLFSSSSSSPVIKKVDSQSNMKYNAPGSLVKRSSTFSQFPTEKSKTFDFLNEEWVTWISKMETDAKPITLKINDKLSHYSIIIVFFFLKTR